MKFPTADRLPATSGGEPSPLSGPPSCFTLKMAGLASRLEAGRAGMMPRGRSPTFRRSGPRLMANSPDRAWLSAMNVLVAGRAPRMVPTWLLILSWVCLAAAGLSAAWIVYDVYGRGYRQHMRVMEAVWPITALYFGPAAVWAYRTWGTAPVTHRSTDGPEQTSSLSISTSPSSGRCRRLVPKTRKPSRANKRAVS